MPHTITPTDAGNVTAVTVPSDGDAEEVASVNVAFQSIANLAAYCRGFLLGTRSGPTLVAGQFTNSTFLGTTVATTPILGQSGHLFLSQVGEVTHVLGGLTVSSDVTLNGVVSLGAGGRVLKRVLAGATVNTTYAATDADVLAVNPTAGPVTYRLSHTGARQGDTMRISAANATSPDPVVVEDFANPGVSITPSAIGHAAGLLVFADFAYDTTIGWGLIGWGRF